MRRCLIIVALVVALVWLTRLAANGLAQPAAAPAQPAVGPAQPAFAPGQPPAAPVAPMPPANVVPAAPAQPPNRVLEVPEHGYGPTADVAQQNATKEAQYWVEAYLKEHFPDLHVTPDADYLKTEYLTEIGVIRVDKPTERDFHDLGKGFEAVAHVDLSDPNLRKMQEKVDEARRKDLEPEVTKRHLLVGRILGSFVALFLVIFGYIKLEELTRGYYTTLLRVGAGAVVLLAVVGLFWPL
jgi:hypothetical protein